MFHKWLILKYSPHMSIYDSFSQEVKKIVDRVLVREIYFNFLSKNNFKILLSLKF